ncbi:MAG: hypothetical protein AB7V32_03240 [Candidatus Berkiella sp.]
MSSKGPENIEIINSKSSSLLASMKWDDFKHLSKKERQQLAKNPRVQMAKAHKDFMVQRANSRAPMRTEKYYDDMLNSLAKIAIAHNMIRVKEGVSLKVHLANIIKAAKHLDHHFMQVIASMCDEYITCAQKGIAKVNSTTPDSIIYPDNSDKAPLSLEEKRLMRYFPVGASEQPKGSISIYGHKYDPFSPAFADDLYLALETMIVNLTAAYDYAVENKLVDDLFNSKWWLACVDGALSNIAGVWLLIEAPQKSASTDDMIKEVMRGTLPASALLPRDFDSIDELSQAVLKPYLSITKTPLWDEYENFMKKSPFTLKGMAFDKLDKNSLEALQNLMRLTSPSQNTALTHCK